MSNKSDMLENGVFDTSTEYDEKHKKRLRRKYDDIPSTVLTKKKKQNDLYKPPTVEEINNLKETENLYNSNLFRLQIQELLLEVNIKTKRRKHLNSWLESFAVILNSLNEYEFLLSDIKPHCEDELKTNLAKLRSVLKTDQNINLKLVKPESWTKFGLYELNAQPGAGIQLYINLVMPGACFYAKDFLNNRYLLKRYYYLLYIAESLKKAKLGKVNLTCHEGNHLLPVVKVVLDSDSKIWVYLYATPSVDTFKSTRFLPEQNNIKENLFDVDVENVVLKGLPTVLYNNSLSHDVNLAVNIEYAECLKEFQNIQEGIKLICIWLNQRELNVGLGGFSNDLVLYFMLYLLYKKKINKYMSSYQVIRNFWSFLATTDLPKEPISLTATSKEIFDSYKKYFDIVCLDKSGCYNFTAFLNMGIYEKIKLECQIALKLLDNNKSNSFQQLFLVKYPFYLQYDLIIDLSKLFPFKNTFANLDEQTATYMGYSDLLICKFTIKNLQKALNQRVLNIVQRITVEDGSIQKFLIGMNLNPDKAFNALEIGPALNNFSAAAEFRDFWAHLSTDRRFRDGSTNVAVYFKTNTMKAKRQIIRKIIDFVIHEKFQLEYGLFYNNIEELIMFKKVVPSYPSGSNEETILRVIQTSDKLNTKLRALQMSLRITGVQGVSEVYSFTDVFPPIPTNYKDIPNTVLQGNNRIFAENKKVNIVPPIVQTVECVFQLEHSSKWPNDLQALRHIKTSFYLEISKKLQNEYSIISHVTPNFIDILYEGIVFRYNTYIAREVGLLKKVEIEGGLTKYQDSTESFELEKKIVIIPKLRGALKGIQSLYPSFGPGTCLIKRWLRSQLIDNYLFPDIVIELLAASLYLNSYSSQSNTPQILFLRFLKFFSDLDWNLQTILVNFNDDITNEQIADIESKLQQNRQAYPHLFILTPYDQCLSVFTKDSPSKETLFRVQQLAKESLRLCIDQTSINIKSIFVPNLDGYNILIHLKPSANARRYQDITVQDTEGRLVVEKYSETKESNIPIVNFDPVESYLTTLRKNYGKYAVFFHDFYGGNVIGVLWNPRVYKSSTFKVSAVNACKMNNDKICFNMDGVIEDFYILGSGLIKTIERR